MWPTVDNFHVDLFNEVIADPYPIYIPTYNRSGTAPLLNLLSMANDEIKDIVTLVVREEQSQDYLHHYPWADQVIVVEPGLGPARSRALESAIERDIPRIIMMDDDIKHVSLLERISREGKNDHSRRYSPRVTGIPEPENMLLSLGIACLLADRVFELEDTAVYGACRNALFSGGVDTSIGATLNKGTFPASVMFYDVTRMENIYLPKEFHMHGEDIAFAMDVMNRGQDWFTLPVVAFDQDGNIETTIPLDPLDSVARRVDIENAEKAYPAIHPYLRESMKNKNGGVMRVGMNWKKWYKDTESEPITITTEELVRGIL